VVDHHTYAIGGNSNHEYLGPPDKLSEALSSNTCESCNTYNMLKLTRHVFEWEPNADCADFYERAHLNHMLASQNPADGMMTYFMPLSSGAHREYSDPDNNWTCCHGSGMETHTKHADSVYFYSGASKLYVCQFIPTETELARSRSTSQPVNQFPRRRSCGSEDNRVLSRIASPSCFAIRVGPQSRSKLGLMARSLRILQSPHPSRRSIGPGRVATWSNLICPCICAPRACPTIRSGSPFFTAHWFLPPIWAIRKDPSRGYLFLVTGGRPAADWLAPEGNLEFHTKGAGKPDELVLRPFYAIHHNRYATYFDEFSEEQWKNAEVDYRAEEERQKDLVARTVDSIRIGEMQPERDHNLRSEKNDVRAANGRGFRTPLDGGWLEFEMKADPNSPLDLVSRTGQRAHPAELRDTGRRPKDRRRGPRSQPANAFFDEIYAIPDDLSKGKQKLVVRVQATEHKAARLTCWSQDRAGVDLVGRWSLGSPRGKLTRANPRSMPCPRRFGGNALRCKSCGHLAEIAGRRDRSHTDGIRFDIQARRERGPR